LGLENGQTTLALSMAELQALLDATDKDDLEAYLAKAEQLRTLVSQMIKQATEMKAIQDDPDLARALILVSAVEQRTAALRPTNGETAEAKLIALRALEDATREANVALHAAQAKERAALVRVEADAFRDETDALTNRHEAERDRATADLNGRRGVAEANLNGELALVEVERSRVAQVGTELLDLEAQRRAGTQRAQIQGAIDGARVNLSAQKADRVANEEMRAREEAYDRTRKNEETLSQWLAHVVAFAGQTTTAALSTIGFASMAEERTVAVWVISASSAMAVSGAMFGMIEGHMRGGWAIRRNPVMAAMFFALATVTAGANYGGAVAELRPNGVMTQSWDSQDKKGTTFLTEAREKLDVVNTTTAASVDAVIAAGNKLVDETLGRGASGQYGFKAESIRKLADYRQTLTDAVAELSAANDCEGLEALDKNYKEMMDRLQAEKDRNPSFAVADFVVGGRYDWTDKDQVDACEAVHPISGRVLAGKIETELTVIRDELAQGTLKDPSTINPRIATLNQEMKTLAGMVDMDAVELEKMDPLMFQALKVLVENTVATFDNLANGATNNIAYWPYGYAVLSLAMDQIGLLFSILVWVSRGNTERARRELEAYMTRQGETAAKPEPKASAWSRIKGMFSRQ
jgi:hypothetical protein